ncbi:MAG TPA: hypothetical protein PK720_03615 [bacterium]|jgi:hypothetical protein|nr:hypothetical protein [bacterium]
MHPVRIYKNIVITLIIIFWLLFIFSWSHIYQPRELDYGVTFSQKQSQGLGLDWKKNYLAMLDELGVKKLRLPVYWDIVQPENGRYDWVDLDWQINEAEKRNVELILVMGNRVPRWPECHLPSWVEKMEAADRQSATLSYITETINRYHDRPTITYWQVENEPFLKYFGVCPDFDLNFLDKEIALVRSLDSRPVIVTDSGELSAWIPAAKRGDVFGSTLYLNTYSKTVDRYIRYPISPFFFRIKKNIANLFAHPQDWIMIEVQGEPWGKTAFQDLPQEERDLTMDAQKFKEILEFSRQTGFRTFYLWGVEWWYWEKETRHNDFYWEETKKLFNHQE